MSKTLIPIILFFILIIGALPRGIELINGNYLFGYDQGQHFLEVKKIVVDHHLTLIGTQVGGAGGFFQGPGWYYLLAIPFFLTGGNPYGAIALMFFLGMATVFLTFIFASEMFDKWTGIAVAFLTAVSPALIANTRFVWPPFPIYLLTVFFLFFLYKIFQNKEKFFPLLTCTVGLMAHFEIATAGLFFGHLFFLVPILFIKKLISFRYFVLGILSFVLPFTPLILFDLRHNFLLSKGMMNFLTSNDNSSHQVTYLYITKMFENHYAAFKYNFAAAFSSDILLVVIFILLIIGTYYILVSKRYSFAQKLFTLYLAISPIVFFLLSMIYIWPMWEWWIRHLQIYYLFLLGIVLVSLWRNYFAKAIVSVIILIMLANSIKHIVNFYKNDFNDYGGTNKIKGKLQAIDYIYQDAKGKPFGILIFSPPIYTYPYDYLLWWYGEKKYGYEPYTEKKGTFYLLIEGDPHQPWTYGGWMETVVKTGKIIETKTLSPSGFIIQKRTAENK